MTKKKAKEDFQKAGRPTVMTPAIIDKLEQAFSFDFNDQEACLFADIWPSVLYRYEEKHPEFKERKKALRNRPLMLAKTTIVKNIGDLSNAQWYADRKGDFKPKQAVELSGVDGAPIQQAIQIEFVNSPKLENPAPPSV